MLYGNTHAQLETTSTHVLLFDILFQFNANDFTTNDITANTWMKI